MSSRGEVLVAIMNKLPDFERARDEGWYRIPVTSAEKWCRGRWPPKWVAFYQTEVFEPEAYAVKYYAHVLDVRQVTRSELFPDEAPNAKTELLYYKLTLGPLLWLPRPILSRRRRRITFITTTREKLLSAVEINDLSDESPLEDRLWAEMKSRQIEAERQEFVKAGRGYYALDFAIRCAAGKLDVETDGDTWHADPKRKLLDRIRDEELAKKGWRVLRFSGRQVREQSTEHCLPTIVENIEDLGGVSQGEMTD